MDRKDRNRRVGIGIQLPLRWESVEAKCWIKMVGFHLISLVVVAPLRNPCHGHLKLFATPELGVEHFHCMQRVCFSIAHVGLCEMGEPHKIIGWQMCSMFPTKPRCPQ